ncbi:MAG: GlcG/HbpS family heme-binding protein [Ferruginibacter sp.]
MLTKFVSALIVLFSLQTKSFAQLPTKYLLTQKAAHKILDEALQLAKTLNTPGGSIAIVDDAGTLVLLERLDGTFLKASDVSIAKAQTAALFKKDTKFFEDKINTDRPALITVGPNMLKGGVPIFYKGQLIGAIGVSGTASADQDVQLAEAGAKAVFDN